MPHLAPSLVRRWPGSRGGPASLEGHRVQAGIASRAGGCDCQDYPGPLRWGKPPGREWGGEWHLCQARSCWGRKSGCGPEEGELRGC